MGISISGQRDGEDSFYYKFNFIPRVSRNNLHSVSDYIIMFSINISSRLLSVAVGCLHTTR